MYIISVYICYKDSLFYVSTIPLAHSLGYVLPQEKGGTFCLSSSHQVPHDSGVREILQLLPQLSHLFYDSKLQLRNILFNTFPIKK